MGSAGSCCCGSKSVSVVATNTDARPWSRGDGMATSTSDLHASSARDTGNQTTAANSCVRVDSIEVLNADKTNVLDTTSSANGGGGRGGGDVTSGDKFATSGDGDVTSGGGGSSVGGGGNARSVGGGGGGGGGGGARSDVTSGGGFGTSGGDRALQRDGTFVLRSAGGGGGGAGCAPRPTGGQLYSGSNSSRAPMVDDRSKELAHRTTRNTMKINNRQAARVAGEPFHTNSSVSKRAASPVRAGASKFNKEHRQQRNVVDHRNTRHNDADLSTNNLRPLANSKYHKQQPPIALDHTNDTHDTQRGRPYSAKTPVKDANSNPSSKITDAQAGEFTRDGLRGHAATLFARDGTIIYGNHRERGQSADIAPSPVRRKNESFYLPMQSLVAPEPVRKSHRKKGKKGTAFLVTFNDSGVDSESLGGHGDGEDDESEDDDSEESASRSTVSTPPGSDASGLGRWNANRTSLETTVPSNESANRTYSTPHGETPATNAPYNTSTKQNPYMPHGATPANNAPSNASTKQNSSHGETIKHFEAYKERRRNIEKSNYRSFSPNQVTIGAASRLGDTNEVSANERTASNSLRVARIIQNESRDDVSKDRYWPYNSHRQSRHVSDRHKSKSELEADVAALQQHVRDLRQLLRIQIRQHEHSRTPRQTPTSKSRIAASPATGLSDHLVRNFQTEIVRLEDEMVSKQALINKQQNAKGNSVEDHKAESDNTTVSDADEKEAIQSYNQALSALDHDFANKLTSAEDNLSDEELRQLLDAHIQQRQRLKEQLDDSSHSISLPIRSGTFTTTEAGEATSSAHDSDASSTSRESLPRRSMVDGFCNTDAVNANARDVANKMSSACTSDVSDSSDSQREVGGEQKDDVPTAAHSQITNRQDMFTQYDEDNARENAAIKTAVDSFTEAAISRDEAFTQTVWVRRDQMSPDELQRLLSEHFNDVSNLRRMRNNENDRLADNLKNKLSLKGAPDAGDESDSDPDGRDSDVGEATADEDASRNCTKAQRLPVTSEELERMLREYRERQGRLLEAQMAKNRHHEDAIAIRLRMAQQCRAKNEAAACPTSTTCDAGVDDAGIDDAGGVGVQTSGTETTSTSSQHAPATTEARRRGADGGDEKADALLVAHRDRRKDLQRRRHEDRQAKDEKLRSKLKSRLRRRNDDGEKVADDGSDVSL